MSFKDLWMLVLGYALIIFGIIGILLPILQGTPFLIAGLYILSEKATWAKKLIKYLEKKYPKIIEKAHRINESIKKYFDKVNS